MKNYHVWKTNVDWFLLKFIRIMKLTAILLIFFTMHVSATVYSQNTKITLNMQNVSLKDVLQKIESLTDFRFIYENEQITLDKKINIDVKDKNVEAILDQVFNDAKINYSISKNNLILINPLKSESNNQTAKENNISQQQKPVSGKVTDQSGAALPGVSVVVKGTTTGVITDTNGIYLLNNIPVNIILQFSFVGMRTQEISVGNNTTLNVTLVEDVIGLDEVVAIGYGTQKKATKTGAIASVSGVSIASSPSTNLSNNLAGRIPGLTSITQSGQPGADGSTLLIRGTNTLGNNNPLVVVDGVAGRDFARLNAEDIESFTVLKDASAAIYGAQAANGVIIVTTKRGRMGKTKISLDVNTGFNQPTRIPDMANAGTFATMMNEILYYKDQSKGRNQQFTTDDITKFNDGSDPWGHPNTNWFSETLKPWSTQHSEDITITGGKEGITYFVSGGMKTTDANYKNSANNYKQYNFRSNLDDKINEYITVSLDLAAGQEVYNNPGYGGGVTGVWRSLMRGIPTRPAFYPTGQPGPDLEFGDQPVVTTTDATGYNQNVVDKFQSNFRILVKIPWIKGLSIQANAAYDKQVNLSKQFQKPWTLYSWDRGADHILTSSTKGIAHPQLTESTSNGYTATTNIFATYQQTFKEKHSFKAMLGAERQQGLYNNFSAYRQDYISSAIDQLFAGANNSYKNNNGYASQFRRANYFGRFNYDYSEKYLFETVFRYDGSYLFAPGKQFGFFPGISAGWRISEENFWKDNIHFLKEVKLRGSWGQTGNDRINEYQYLSSYAFMGQVYTFGQTNDQNMTYESQVPNPNVTWEVANQANIGFDATLFDDKLSVSADYFNNIRSQILIQRNASVPGSAGITLPPENIGKVQNQGFEGVIGYHGKAGDLKYDLSVNGSYSKNKILFWDETPGIPDYQQSTGQPMGSVLYYQAIGIFKDQASVDAYPHWAGAQPGDVIFKDVNGDKKIDGLDRVRNFHNGTPRFSGGLTINLGYKKFDLSVLFQGAVGAVMYIKPESGVLGNYYQEFAANRWTPENTSASFPRTFDGDAYYWRSQANTFWLRSTDYVRLKNIELGYNLSLSSVRKIGIDALRLYVNGSNLFMLDKAKILDPESNPSGLGIPYPLQRVLNMGVRITFN